jgi:hypothetical protein
VACTTENQQSNLTAVPIKNEVSNSMDQGFDIALQMEKIEDDQYYLSASLELDSGSYVISPFSKDTTYGHFGISIPENNKLIPDGGVVEIPRSVEEYDPILEMPINFVRKNTTYKQKLNLTADDDFEVSGMVFLLIEPQCVPYEVKFSISHFAGKMTVEQVRTTTTKAYQKWLGSTK